jgi:diguanylate cyclase (GGDEF)-like protein
MGGDEMAVVLVGVATVDEATTIADSIRSAVRRAVPDLEPASPTASVGVALSRPGDTVDELLTRADLAMYAAKEQGKDRVAVAP